MLRRRIKLLLSALLMGVMLTGCSSFNMSVKDLQSKLNGLDVVIRTFDEESQVIDKVKGKSVMIERDTTFDTETSEGSNKDSSVIKISIGKNVMHHVGSSLIMAEDGLQDIFEEYAKTVDITNTDRSVPFINSMIDSFKNVTTGKAKVILIRSQNGTPLATYLGNEVSIFSPDIPKTTVLLVDGQVLLIYRCDYTIYDTALLME
jgi:hypothetical protein